MPEFFLELFSEEIPARMQKDAASQLEKICASALQPLRFHPLKHFFGPRRIAINATVDSETASKTIEERGPRETAPEAALNGFLGKHGAKREDVVIEAGYYILRRAVASVPAAAFIVKELPEALAKFSWPKSMRWGQGGDFSWVRPLRSIICLLDGHPVIPPGPFQRRYAPSEPLAPPPAKAGIHDFSSHTIPIQIGPITASNETEGHRTLAPCAFPVSSCADWQEKLRAHYVIADQEERREKILRGITEQAAIYGLTVVKDEALIDEVTGLVEWPVPLIGKIDKHFMDLPPEVRELSMKVNQRYFALRDAAGNPAPYFAFVANLEAPDNGAAIVAGNERVLRARLSDARHFWDLDLKTPLDELLPKLDHITFHAKIGSQGERVKRIAQLADEIALALGATKEMAILARTAGMLSKADLVTGMVGEFPELQGIIGGYYAERNSNGWDGQVVGPAIKTHYLPKGPSDDVPKGIVAISVALADKLDTLMQFFIIGERPTGSGDPFALRRAALGVIRIILENDLTLPLKPVLGGDDALFAFIIERLRIKLRGEGKRFDVLDAVLGADSGDKIAGGLRAIRHSAQEFTDVDDDLVRLMKRVNAVSDFLSTPNGANLLAGYRRAVNILRIEEVNDGPVSGDPDQALFVTPEERGLSMLLNDLVEPLQADLSRADFTAMMDRLAPLRAPVDEFFEKVTVNTDSPDLRGNRLKLLAQLRDTMHRVGKFSKIEG